MSRALVKQAGDKTGSIYRGEGGEMDWGQPKGRARVKWTQALNQGGTRLV